MVVPRRSSGLANALGEDCAAFSCGQNSFARSKSAKPGLYYTADVMLGTALEVITLV